MYAPRHQVKFLVCVNLPGNKPVSDSDMLPSGTWCPIKLHVDPQARLTFCPQAVFISLGVSL